MARRAAVQASSEFQRIAALPRRVLTQEMAVGWAATLTKRLRKKGSKATLLPWQALCLAEVCDNRGGMLGLPPGHGKTLIGYLLPTMLGVERTLIIIGATLRDQTEDMHRSYYKDWQSPKGVVKVMSRELLQSEAYANFLEQFNPQLVFIDECDDQRNPDNAVSHRLDRFRVAHSEAVFVGATGTPSRDSIMSFWHIICWCLHLGTSPLPYGIDEARMWAAVLDAKTTRAWRPDPGPLGATRDEALVWVRDRICQTPGVVFVDEDSCDQPLVLRTRLAREDTILDDAYREFLVVGVNPGGIPVTDSLSRYSHDLLMGCGLYTYWDPPPPEEWRIAYRAYAKYVRDRIKFSQDTSHPLDTEAQVVKAYPSAKPIREWLEVKDTFKDDRKVAWIAESTLLSALDWLRESDEPSIIWCGSVEFGRRLSELTGLPYYGRLGRNDAGESITRAPRTTVIASWQANKRGLNLQQWRRHLVIGPPGSAHYFEQLVARAHRKGQDGEVEFVVLLTSGGTIDLFRGLFDEARFVKSITTITQKILRAGVDLAHPSKNEANRFRWASRSEDPSESENKDAEIQQTEFNFRPRAA